MADKLNIKKTVLPLMGKIVTVTSVMERREYIIPSQTLLVWKKKKLHKQRAGWVVGCRWVQAGKYITDYGDEHFQETSPRIPCLLVAFWPSQNLVKVPLDGYCESKGETPHSNNYQWTDRDRKDLRLAMEDWPRDKRGVSCHLILKRKDETAMMKYIAILFTICTLALPGACNPCEPGSVRCNGTVVEICRPDKKWAKVQDCSALKRTSNQLFDCCCRKINEKNKCFCCPQPTVKKQK